MKPQKYKSCAAKLIVPIILLALTYTVMAAVCYKVVSYLCKTSGSEPCSKDCPVNCLCPHDAVINGVCHKTFNLTCAWTDSTQHSLNCTGGDKFDSCQVDGVGLENACSYSKQVIVCPSVLPTPLVCVPTLSYQVVTEPRTTVITGNPCDIGG